LAFLRRSLLTLYKPSARSPCCGRLGGHAVAVVEHADNARGHGQITAQSQLCPLTRTDTKPIRSGRMDQFLLTRGKVRARRDSSTYVIPARDQSFLDSLHTLAARGCPPFKIVAYSRIAGGFNARSRFRHGPVLPAPRPTTAGTRGPSGLVPGKLGFNWKPFRVLR
jgi:hypothetical protein